MPVYLTIAARAQVTGTATRYLRSTPRRAARPAAARKLAEAYQTAVTQMSLEPKVWFSHPRPYPSIASYGFRWIKIHRYWFAYVPGADPLITNILDETADIPGRISADQTPSGLA